MQTNSHLDTKNKDSSFMGSQSKASKAGGAMEAAASPSNHLIKDQSVEGEEDFIPRDSNTDSIPQSDTKHIPTNR